MKTQVRLNLYERGIVIALVEYFGYTVDGARDLVVQYIGVIRKLGGYDSCLDHAERLHLAKLKDYSPERWLEKIHKLDTETEINNEIPRFEERYVHV
jgi:hypothetical protein